jgi:GrpB-like predicted nucleotidyltransferase (UPF0157 family)
MAAAELARLKIALGDVPVAVHPIGPTAVPGIPARPIAGLIPVLMELASLETGKGPL